MYMSIPEFNRSCIKAERDRAYRVHLETLQSMRPSEKTTYSHSLIFSKQQKKSPSTKSRDISKSNYSPRASSRSSQSSPQKSYNLQRKIRREDQRRIQYENEKLVKTISSLPNQYDKKNWFSNKVDSDYQVAKNSVYLETVPMSVIISRVREQNDPHSPVRSGSSRCSYSQSENSSPRKFSSRNGMSSSLSQKDIREKSFNK